MKNIIKQKGFTLVELLIVVIILSVLSGIAIPSYFIITERANISATKADMKNISTCLEIYLNKNTHYPSSAQGISILEDENMMADVPDSDKWGSSYVYESDGQEYELRSLGSDKVSSTQDDIVLENGIFTSGNN